MLRNINSILHRYNPVSNSLSYQYGDRATTYDKPQKILPWEIHPTIIYKAANSIRRKYIMEMRDKYKLSASEKNMLEVLVFKTDPITGVGYPSIETLRKEYTARQGKISTRCVINILGRLQAKGVTTKRRRGANKTNEYVLSEYHSKFTDLYAQSAHDLSTVSDHSKNNSSNLRDQIPSQPKNDSEKQLSLHAVLMAELKKCGFSQNDARGLAWTVKQHGLTLESFFEARAIFNRVCREKSVQSKSGLFRGILVNLHKPYIERVRSNTSPKSVSAPSISVNPPVKSVNTSPMPHLLQNEAQQKPDEAAIERNREILLNIRKQFGIPTQEEREAQEKEKQQLRDKQMKEIMLRHSLYN